MLSSLRGFIYLFFIWGQKPTCQSVKVMLNIDILDMDVNKDIF